MDNEIEALSIFERTNARGLDLEASDLLKNFLFSKKVDAIQELWDTILENSGGTILRMLKYFYVSKKGLIQKPQLYKKLKGYGVEIGPQNLTDQLAAFSEFYKVVKTPDKNVLKTFFENNDFPEIAGLQHRYETINRSLEGLREFNVVQFCPVAYAAISCIVRLEGQGDTAWTKKLIQLCATFEKYHFVNNVICERVGNDVERLYADYCVNFSQTNDPVKTTDELANQLKSRLAKEDEFIAKFTDLSYSPDQLGLIAYIFDRFNNRGLDPGQCIQIYNPDPKLRRRNYNIEHFLPQTPEAGVKVKKADADSVDSIGNLLPIYFKRQFELRQCEPGRENQSIERQAETKGAEFELCDRFYLRVRWRRGILGC